MSYKKLRETAVSAKAPQFLFDFGSPNAFLSHEAIPAIEKRTGAKFEYVPILLGGIFKSTNNKSPAETLAGVKNKREFHALETERFVKRFQVQPYVWNPFFPINTNQPKNPTMKSFSATVRPAPASPRNVPRFGGGPKITSKMKSTPTTCSDTRVTPRRVSI